MTTKTLIEQKSFRVRIKKSHHKKKQYSIIQPPVLPILSSKTSFKEETKDAGTTRDKKGSSSSFVTEVLPYRSERRRILDDTHGGVVYDSGTTRERALRKSRLLLSLFLFSSGAEPAAEINVGTFVLFRALGVPSASQHSKIVFSFRDARHVTGGHARRQRLPVLVH